MIGDRVRAALVGAGFWGTHAHLPALLAQPDVDIVAVADAMIERARAVTQARGISAAYASMEQLLQMEHPQLVVIATPTDQHPAQVEAALAAGCAVLCEKPLANTVVEAFQVATLADAVTVPSSVGYSFRYGPAVQALKRDITRGALGVPWLLEMFEYNAQFHPARGKVPGWKGDPACVPAGALLEYGSHLIDLAGWLAGSIVAVQSSLARVLPGARVDDIATLQLCLQGSAIGVLVSGWVLSGSIPGIKVRFHGSEGLAEVEMNQTIPGGHAYRRATLDGVMEEMPLEGLGEELSAYARRHISDIAARLKGQSTPFAATLPSLHDGVRVQQVIEAAVAASDTWETINVDLRTTTSRRVMEESRD
jgi:predicted dehydrogenase